MPAQEVNAQDDSFCFLFKIGEGEFKFDSLVFSSVIMDRTKGDEDPERDVVLAAMREAAIGSIEGVTEHQLFAMSLRMTRMMGQSGKE
jgi:hypothetical protein